MLGLEHHLHDLHDFFLFFCFLLFCFFAFLLFANKYVLNHRREIAFEQVRVLSHETVHGVSDRTRIVFYPGNTNTNTNTNTIQYNTNTNTNGVLSWKLKSQRGEQIMVWKISRFLHSIACRMNEFLMVKQHERNKWSTMQTRFIRSQFNVRFLPILFNMFPHI